MKWFGRRVQPELAFWQSFASLDLQLFRFEQNRERLFSALSVALTRVHPDLTFEIGPEKDGRRDLVISAAGLKDAFPAVEALVDAAPALERWNVIAFRPPRDPDVQLELGGVQVRSAEAKVALESDGTRVGVTLFLPGYHKTPQSTYEQLGFLLLDNALGEKAVETRLGFVEFGEVAAAPVNAMSFLELPRAITDWYTPAGAGDA